ncbi:MAG: tRNA pseudouridine(13) synthase TruD [Planctomycetes bacterium]|nr:tRNA pseudouridine(13) synthase TruD [Planctomycetota bacterium]
MRIKQRLEDFRVRELLRPDFVTATGEWRVYRVTKKKMTSMEAAAALAREAGVGAGEVFMAGFKDRQGITTQHMAVHHGKEVTIAASDLKVEGIGFAERELTSRDSDGNAFELVVRGLDQEELAVLRGNLQVVRDVGLVNYFDEQRFGNLRHGQGWIALDLLHGEHEKALKQLLATPSAADDPKTKSFRTALHHSWGNWAECRDIAGRFGQHHSVFEHLKKNRDDFAGAFYHLASRLRLIHLYAYQSHLWNRAVAGLVRARTERSERRVVDSEEGPLVYPLSREKVADLGESFRLPGPRLEDVTNVEQRRALEEVLARDHILPPDFDIRGVSGFQLKGEDRPLFITPGHLRVRPSEPDEENRGMALVKMRFDLPRGAYATLVVRRMLARPLAEGAEGDETSSSEAPRRDDTRERDERPYRGHGYSSGGDRGSDDRRPRDFHREGGDRGQRPWTPNARNDRPYRPRSDDSRGSGNFRPRSDDSRGAGNFRREGGDRPYRPRPDDRRGSYDRPFRPREDDRGRSEPRREGGDRPYRPWSPPSDRGYRPRSDDNRGPRGPGEFRREGGYRPYRPAGDGDRSYRPRPDDRGPSNDRGGNSGGGARPYRAPYGHGGGRDAGRDSGGDRGRSDRPQRGPFRPRGFGRGRDERSGGDRPLR